MQFELITPDRRLFDLDMWDWSMILGGSLLAGAVRYRGVLAQQSQEPDGGEPRRGHCPAAGRPNSPDAKKQCN
jgi:hypothetical protein